MSTLIIIVHIVVAVALILIVLLQTGKGADMGAAFGGGGGQTLFGATGASTFLSRLTTVAAIVFMLTSLSLAYLSSHRSSESVMKELTPPPAEQPGPALPESPVEGASAPAETTTETETMPAEAPASPVAEDADVETATPPAPAGDTEPVKEEAKGE
jgi:preprotein translocase subunit SecG